MAIPDAVLLFAMGRAHARIHIEHDSSRRTAVMNAVDPLTGEISKRRKVLFRCEPTCFEAAHLACRSGASRGSLAPNDPAHRGIMPQPLGIVHILVAGQTAQTRIAPVRSWRREAQERERQAEMTASSRSSAVSVARGLLKQGSVRNGRVSARGLLARTPEGRSCRPFRKTLRKITRTSGMKQRDHQLEGGCPTVFNTKQFLSPPSRPAILAKRGSCLAYCSKAKRQSGRFRDQQPMAEKICDNCRYWSKLVVKIRKTNIEAACLNRGGPFFSLFCRGDQCCPSWESGHLGRPMTQPY
jgi:hypothetical protein